MAANRTLTTLSIALIVFVMLTFMLAVTTYLFFKQKFDAENAARDSGEKQLRAEDELRERWLSQGSLEPIGTTKRGIGPCYADKALRGSAIRMGDLLRPEVLAERLPSICKLKSAMLGAVAIGDSVSTSFDPEAMGELCGRWRGRRDRLRGTAAP